MQNESAIPTEPVLGKRLVTFKQAAAKLGTSVLQLRRIKKKDPTFPDPVELIRGNYRLWEHEIDDWALAKPRRTAAERAADTTAAATLKLAALRSEKRAASKPPRVAPKSKSSRATARHSAQASA